MPAGAGIDKLITLMVSGRQTSYPTLLRYSAPAISYIGNDLGPVLGSQLVLIVGKG